MPHRLHWARYLIAPEGFAVFLRLSGRIRTNRLCVLLTVLRHDNQYEDWRAVILAQNRSDVCIGLNEAWLDHVTTDVLSVRCISIL